ncbi:MAG: glycosyl transferase family 2 [Flavobacterium psychrophilum]|nr:MAG: glycosyl transferase family 2 [Flavobacterium psychrophilum]
MLNYTETTAPFPSLEIQKKQIVEKPQREFKIQQLKTQRRKQLLVLAGTFFLLIGAAIGCYFLKDEFEQLNLDRLATNWGIALLIVTGALFLFQVSFFIYNIVLYFKYKLIKSVSDEELPVCTVIVPAYNEGRLVFDTLVSLVKSNYPEAKLEIMAIDDGSKDDTWEWMQRAKTELGNRISICQQPENKGKRHALYRGFQSGKGEVFVTVDSDSVVTADTLRNLVSPFVKDENCGAVAGNVRVLNNKKAIIPKMLNVSFAMSFEFMRSAESALGTVMCTPGALAAYKRDAVFNCLEEWIDQSFMGQPSNIGEDRAMTNMILKQGYHVVFQKNAVVFTNVPEKLSGLSKMFIRWGRSNIRENIMMSKFIFAKFREGSRFGARLLFINQFIRIVMAYPLILLMLLFVATHPLLFLSSTLVSILVFSSFSVLFYSKKHNVKGAFWAYSYSILYTFCLFWITPYAIATMGRSGWLTRELVQEKSIT